MNTEIENPDVVMPIVGESILKNWVVSYIGEKLQPENGDVTVEMAVEVFAAEFPEFLMAVAEENFIRGYQQAMTDIAVVQNSTESPTEE